MRDDTDMDRRSAVRTMLGVGALPLVGACAGAAGTRSQLTPRQRAGQRVIFSYPGLAVPPALLRQISAGQAAGVIFFGENVSSEAQIAAVIRQLRQAQRRDGQAFPRAGTGGGAAASFGRYGQRAVLAAQAGMDLLLCSARDVSQGQAVVAALAGALDAGKLGLAGFNAAVQRVTALRNGLR